MTEVEKPQVEKEVKETGEGKGRMDMVQFKALEPKEVRTMFETQPAQFMQLFKQVMLEQLEERVEKGITAPFKGKLLEMQLKDENAAVIRCPLLAGGTIHAWMRSLEGLVSNGSALALGITMQGVMLPVESPYNGEMLARVEKGERIGQEGIIAIMRPGANTKPGPWLYSGY